MKYSLVSERALEDNYIKCHFVRIAPKDGFSGWVVFAEADDRNIIHAPSGKVKIVETEIIEKRLPEFRLIKELKVGSIFVHNAGFDKLVEVKREATNHLSNGSFATNQSNVNVSFSQWFKHQRKPLIYYYLIIGTLIIATLYFEVIFPLGMIFSGVGLFIIINFLNRYKDKVREYFKFGDTLPGIVVSTNPLKVAAMTDLTKGYGHYPIIKIFELGSSRINGSKLFKGDRLPLVALYFTIEGSVSNYWYDIESYPIAYAISDPNEIAKRVYSISEFDWIKLEDSLSQIEDLNKSGVYKIDIDKSDWLTELKGD